MKKYTLSALSVLLFISILVYDAMQNQAQSSANGPVAGRTGSPGDGGANCTGCHSGPTPTIQTGWITSTIPGTGYVAGATYTITATAFGPGHVRFGFQICPQNTAGTKLGTLLITDAANTKLTSGYISHTNAGTLGSTNSHTWSFNWVAPATGSGDVTFYGAFLITNNSNNSIGDTCYYSRLTVSEAPCNAPAQPGTFTSASSVCAGGSMIFSVAAVSGATSYTWSLPSGWTGTSTTNTINVTAGSNSGTVSVAAVNACGNSPSSTAFITVNALPSATITPSGSTTFCQGGSVTLSAPAGNNYVWSPGGSTSSSISATTSGTYSVTVTNSNGCTSSSSQSVTVNALPSASISPSGSTTFCQGGSVNLTASGGTSYAWSPGGSTSASLNVTSSGSYTVTVTNSNNCTSVATQSVTVRALPNAQINASGPVSFCQGGSVTLTATGGNSYIWSPGGSTSASLSVNSQDTYSVTVTDGNNCSSSATQSVNVFALPTAQISSSGSTTFCQGGSVDLTASGGNTFSWSPGGSTNSVLTATTSGTYAVVVTDGNNCSGSTSVSVLVHPLPSASINASGPVAFCDGGSVELTASGGGSYSWLPGGETSSAITAATSGTFTVTVTDGNNCSSSSSATITVHPLPSVTLDPFADVCDTLAPFILSGGNPAGGVYSVDGSSGSVFDPALAGIGPHAISYSYTDQNSCSASAGQSMEVISCVASALSMSASPAVVTLSVSGGSIYVYADENSYPFRLSIMDMSGRILYQELIHERAEGTETRFLSAGIYLVSLESREGSQMVKRISISY